jgi:hypothetical protein
VQKAMEVIVLFILLLNNTATGAEGNGSHCTLHIAAQ